MSRTLGRKRFCEMILLLIALSQLTRHVHAVHDGIHYGRTFDGVVTGFEVLTPIVAKRQPLCVRFTFRNVGVKVKAFRYAASVVPDACVLDSTGRELPLRRDAPTLEPVAPEIDLKGGESFATKICTRISDYYELSPGRYYLQFRYDLRLLENRAMVAQYAKMYGSSDLVLWDERRYAFTVIK